MGHIIPNTGILIDSWQPVPKESDCLRFMTRLSFKKFTNFNKKTCNYVVYTSPFNKWHLVTINEVDPGKIFNLPLRLPVELFSPVLNEKFLVTAIESYYSPGSVMLLFQGSFGTILYTGFFLYNEQILKTPVLMDAILKQSVDVLYIDNTYAAENCNFRDREQVIDHMAEIIRKHPDHKIFINASEFGKEKALCTLSNKLGEKIYVEDSNKMKILKQLGIGGCFVKTLRKTRIIWIHSRAKMEQLIQSKWNVSFPRIIFFLTSYYQGEGVGSLMNEMHVYLSSPDRRNYRKPDKLIPIINDNELSDNYRSSINTFDVYLAPYSTHSYNNELVNFITKIKPNKLIPILIDDESNDNHRSSIIIPDRMYRLCGQSSFINDGNDKFDPVVNPSTSLHGVTLLFRIIDDVVVLDSGKYNICDESKFGKRQKALLLLLLSNVVEKHNRELMSNVDLAVRNETKTESPIDSVSKRMIFSTHYDDDFNDDYALPLEVNIIEDFFIDSGASILNNSSNIFDDELNSIRINSTEKFSNNKPTNSFIGLCSIFDDNRHSPSPTFNDIVDDLALNDDFDLSEDTSLVSLNVDRRPAITNDKTNDRLVRCRVPFSLSEPSIDTGNNEINADFEISESEGNFNEESWSFTDNVRNKNRDNAFVRETIDCSKRYIDTNREMMNNNDDEIMDAFLNDSTTNDCPSREQFVFDNDPDDKLKNNSNNVIINRELDRVAPKKYLNVLKKDISGRCKITRVNGLKNNIRGRMNIIRSSSSNLNITSRVKLKKKRLNNTNMTNRLRIKNKFKFKSSRINNSSNNKRLPNGTSSSLSCGKSRLKIHCPGTNVLKSNKQYVRDVNGDNDNRDCDNNFHSDISYSVPVVHEDINNTPVLLKVSSERLNRDKMYSNIMMAQIDALHRINNNLTANSITDTWQNLNIPNRFVYSERLYS